MKQLRIRSVRTLELYRLELELTDGTMVVRDVADLLNGPVFAPVKSERVFRTATVEGGTVAWESGADICPDVLIWGGAPPELPDRRPEEFLRILASELSAPGVASRLRTAA